MMIKNTPSIGSIDPAKSNSQKEDVAPRVRSDRVSTVEGQQVLATARSVQAKVGSARAAMLAQVENAVRSGAYAPSASQLADRLLNAAEIDARLQALLRG
jgi:anti-sigma28 factor (negative regulator of flagellin synthesis)